MDREAMVLLIFDISNESCVEFLESGVSEEEISSLEINFERSSVEDCIQSIPVGR
jgi:hypothetical protein